MMRAQALCLFGCLAGASAAAQGVPPYDPSQTGPATDYRAGVPEVLRPQPTTRGSVPQSVIIDHFRTAYRSGRSPRMAIFWNRTLTDQIEAQHLDIDSERRGAIVGGVMDSHGGTSSSASRQPYGYGTLNEGSAIGERHTTFGAAGVSARDRIKTHAQVGSGARDPVLNEPDTWRFEQGFNGTFESAGARLIDRNTIIRLAGRGAAGSNDVQQVELSALKGHADLIIEVLSTPDTASPSGYIFRATVKEIATGRILADVSSDGAEESAVKEWMATSRGFEERKSRKASATNGTQVALALMDRLTAAWTK